MVRNIYGYGGKPETDESQELMCLSYIISGVACKINLARYGASNVESCHGCLFILEFNIFCHLM